MIHCEILFWSVNSGGASNDAFTAIEDAVTGLDEFPCLPQPWAARVAALQSATGYKEIDNADLIQAPRRTKDDLYEVNILNEPDTTVFVLG